MSNLEIDVENFMDRHDLYQVSTLGEHPPYKDRFLRVRLIQEEAAELTAAMQEENLEAIADALGDLLYVIVGAFILYRMPLDLIFREVHNSNMTKSTLDATSKGGKILGKTGGFKPPRFEKILKLEKNNIAQAKNIRLKTWTPGERVSDHRSSHWSNLYSIYYWDWCFDCCWRD